MNLRSFQLPYSRISLVPNVGLHVAISNAFAEVDGNWRVKFHFMWVPFPWLRPFALPFPLWIWAGFSLLLCLCVLGSSRLVTSRSANSHSCATTALIPMPVSPGEPCRCLSPHWGMQVGKLLWGENHKPDGWWGAELGSPPSLLFHLLAFSSFSLKAALPSLYSHASWLPWI